MSGSEKFSELFGSQPCVAQDSSENSFLELLVKWHDQGMPSTCFLQPDVAAALTND